MNHLVSGCFHVRMKVYVQMGTLAQASLYGGSSIRVGKHIYGHTGQNVYTN